MAKARFLIPLAAAMVAGAPFAADIAPGLWRIQMSAVAAGVPGTASPPVTLTECFTAGDAQDPSRLLGSLLVPGVPGAPGCDYTDKSYSGDTFHFAMACAGASGVQAWGTLTFTAENFDGTITTTSNLLGGPAVTIESRVSAKRMGGC